MKIILGKKKDTLGDSWALRGLPPNRFQLEPKCLRFSPAFSPTGTIRGCNFSSGVRGELWRVTE